MYIKDFLDLLSSLSLSVSLPVVAILFSVSLSLSLIFMFSKYTDKLGYLRICSDL